MRANWGVDKTWSQPTATQLETNSAEWKKAVTRTFDWVEH
jgi:glycerol kinase